MKKIRLIVQEQGRGRLVKPNRIFILPVLLLAVVSCQYIEQGTQNETVRTTSAEAQDTELQETGTEITVVSIRDMTPADAALPDVEEPFWEDERYLYIFGNPISEYVTVEYSDGSTQNVKEALADGTVGINDLDRFCIKYYADKKEMESPIGYGSEVTAFNNIRELICRIESGTLHGTEQEIYDAHGCDTDALRELTGMDDGYSEFLVEWCGGLNYSICYQKDEQVIAFTPFYTREQFEQSLSGMDTYESLAENELIRNLVKTESETDEGIMYACTYDTGKVKGLRSTYHDTIGDDGIRRIVTNRYGADGENISGSVYVVDEEIPFHCSVSGFEADMDFAKQLETKFAAEELLHDEN